MENLQMLKYCPWVAEELNPKEYFEKYNKILDDINGSKSHNEEFNYEEKVLEFFNAPEEYEMPLPQISRAGSTSIVQLSNRNDTELTDNNESNQPSESMKSDNKAVKIDSKSNEEINIPSASSKCSSPVENIFSFNKMEDDCSIDLLDVEGELPSKDIYESGAIKDSGRVTNWFAGRFMDGVIPDSATKTLRTLACQSRELYRRETVRDYTRLRHRLLKYSSTVRMVVRQETAPELVSWSEGAPSDCLRDLVFNVRIMRPYHKKTYHIKNTNRFPKHSQELLLLGSQPLTALRDAIVCMNDVFCQKSMAADPTQHNAGPPSKDEYPSAFFYIGGVFYSDMRDTRAIDHSAVVRAWAKKHDQIGPMRMENMETSKLCDVNLRLGYPYSYQHLGNCEHLIIFTDTRLHHRSDVSEVPRYPLTRGNPVKLSVKCYICSFLHATWLIKGYKGLPVPYAHVCDKCLKLYFYDSDGKQKANFSLYPFVDEIAAAVMLKAEKKANEDAESLDNDLQSIEEITSAKK